MRIFPFTSSRSHDAVFLHWNAKDGSRRDEGNGSWTRKAKGAALALRICMVAASVGPITINIFLPTAVALDI